MDPSTTDRMTDPGIERRRARRRRRLVLLWAVTLLLLVGQAGAAYYATRARRVVTSTQQEAAPVVARPARPDAGVVADASLVAAAGDSGPPGARTKTKRRPAKARKTRRPDPIPLSGGTDDVSVPRRSAGDADQGAGIARAGCGLCHGRTAGPLDPRTFSPRRWSRYFASGLHGRHTPWRNNFTRTELAHVKAYLMQAARRR
jgi:mono/diheme cytochrome c family protein